jgi:hypothetical protein
LRQQLEENRRAEWQHCFWEPIADRSREASRSYSSAWQGFAGGCGVRL